MSRLQTISPIPPISPIPRPTTYSIQPPDTKPCSTPLASIHHPVCLEQRHSALRTAQTIFKMFIVRIHRASVLTSSPLALTHPHRLAQCQTESRSQCWIRTLWERCRWRNPVFMLSGKSHLRGKWLRRVLDVFRKAEDYCERILDGRGSTCSDGWGRWSRLELRWGCDGEGGLGEFGGNRNVSVNGRGMGVCKE